MKIHSEETKRKIRESCLKRTFPQDVKDKIALRNVEVNGRPVVCLETGIHYESISAAARAYHVAPVSISRVCHNLRLTCKKHTFRFS